jgi:murein DD-endopeptidase MepM/ murein hydrolase activator NlpD
MVVPTLTVTLSSLHCVVLEACRSAISVRVLKVFFFASVLLLLTGKSLNAEDNFRIESIPGMAKQGDVCLIRTYSPVSPTSVHAEFQGERFLLAPGMQNGTYEGLIGIDLSTKPATYEVKVIATDASGRGYSSPFFLKVGKGVFRTQKLSLPRSMVDLDAKTLERVNNEANRLKVLFQTFRDEKLWKGAFVRPLEGKLSSTFGLDRIINGQRRSPHTGVDLESEAGTPVWASNSGMVVLVDDLFFSGKSVILDHGWGLYSMYFHLSEEQVKEGDRVGRGDVLGRVGSTGRSTGPHLHWAIRMNQVRVDPLSLLKLSEHLGE